MSNSTQTTRCTKNITIASGVLRGQRGQCMNKARKGAETCGKHKMPWEK